MGAFDFSELRIEQDRTVKLPLAKLFAGVALPESVADGVLLVAYVGRYNRSYTNAKMRLQSPLLEGVRRTSKPWSAMTEEERTAFLRRTEREEQIYREVACDLYPTRAIKGWERMRNSDGSQSIPYSPDAARDLCEELCKAGQEYLFDQLREFCQDLTNFVANAIPAEQLAGN